MDDVLSLCRAWSSATPAMRTDLERRIIKMINPPSQDECLVAFQVGQYGVFARFAHTEYFTRWFHIASSTRLKFLAADSNS